MRLSKKIKGKKGIALIMALWIMTLLLTVAASFAFMMRAEIKMAKNYRDGVKAHYLALAGVEHAIAVLRNDTGQTDHYGETWHITFRDAASWDNTAVTWDADVKSFGDGTYEVHLSDENSKFNLNYPNRSGLGYLVTPEDYWENPGVSLGIPLVRWQAKICAIRDYVDSGDVATEWDAVGSKGEGDGITRKNKPFETVYEVLRVRNYNANYHIYEGNSAGTYDNPLDTLLKSGVKQRGDQSDMTVYSQDYNTQVDGTARGLDVTTVAHDGSAPSIAAYTAVDFTVTEAGWIVSGEVGGPGGDPIPDFGVYSYQWKGNPGDSPPSPPWTEGVGAPGHGTTDLETNISEANMILAADKMTAGDYGGDDIIEGAVNINTANLYGMQGLFNVGLGTGQNIIDHRLPTADGPFADRGKIMEVPGFNKGYFQDFGDLVTVRSDRFRIYSTGKVKDAAGNTVAARKIEAVVDRHYYDAPFQTPGPIEILYWSEKVFED